MNRLAAAVLYLIAGTVGLVVANGDQDNVLALWALVAVPALALGWIAGGAGWATVVPWLLLPWVLLLVALPYGDADKFTGGDDTHPVAVLAVFPAIFSMLLMLIAVAGRRAYERPLRTHPRIPG
jgi:hypothetical protein